MVPKRGTFYSGLGSCFVMLTVMHVIVVSFNGKMHIRDEDFMQKTMPPMIN